MSAPPPISVLMPIRNCETYLAEAASSLEAQTDPDFEVLAVDDGSSDGTPDLLADWAARDRRVRVIRQPALGIVPALERARSEALGAFLARMDADDRSEPDRFAAQRALLEADAHLSGCGARVRCFPRSVLRDGALRYEEWVNASSSADEVERELFVECPLPHPTFFLRSEVLRSVGGYRDVGWPEDYDLVLRLWEAGRRLAKVPRVLVHWRERPDRLSRTHPTYALDAFVRCKAHYLRRTLLEGREGAVVWGAGPVGKALARVLAAAGAPPRAFVDLDPRKIGQEIHGITVLDTPAGLALPEALHLAAVGRPGVRETLRRTLSGAGLEEGRDFVAVA